MPEGNEGEAQAVPYLGSTISIADLLENVKGLPTINEAVSFAFRRKILLSAGID